MDWRTRRIIVPIFKREIKNTVKITEDHFIKTSL